MRTWLILMAIILPLAGGLAFITTLFCVHVYEYLTRPTNRHVYYCPTTPPDKPGAGWSGPWGICGTTFGGHLR